MRFQLPILFQSFNRFLHEDLLRRYNVGLQREALSAAKSSIQGASSGFVMKFIAPMRLIPPFSTIEPRTSQTSAILTMVKSNEVLYNGFENCGFGCGRIR